jgi:hypothetical protein
MSIFSETIGQMCVDSRKKKNKETTIIQNFDTITEKILLNNDNLVI